MLYTINLIAFSLPVNGLQSVHIMYHCGHKTVTGLIGCSICLLHWSLISFLPSSDFILTVHPDKGN